MLIFGEPGLRPSARLLREEQEKRRRKHQRRIAILGEERAKEKQKQDDDQDEHLFKLIAEARAKREPKCQRRQISKVTDTQLLEYRKRVFERGSTNYQFVKVLKANIEGNYGRRYYINYQVKEMAGSGSPTLNFQAIVKTFKGQATVRFSALGP
ncbi:hypothetical protein RHGRI_018968 [Rhododendron griersonianum]|uniref:Cystatin domain-containing protein n=1 Tax=Rhododendron griersonianum TaxID=479676 RepID=A0AAV6JDB0_9ERIC|nr:hypothetical protein RHGRI_018968 [Rhododendron griersonianum]